MTFSVYILFTPCLHPPCDLLFMVTAECLSMLILYLRPWHYHLFTQQQGSRDAKKKTSQFTDWVSSIYFCGRGGPVYLRVEQAVYCKHVQRIPECSIFADNFERLIGRETLFSAICTKWPYSLSRYKSTNITMHREMSNPPEILRNMDELTFANDYSQWKSSDDMIISTRAHS